MTTKEEREEGGGEIEKEQVLVDEKDITYYLFLDGNIIQNSHNKDNNNQDTVHHTILLNELNIQQ